MCQRILLEYLHPHMSEKKRLDLICSASTLLSHARAFSQNQQKPMASWVTQAYSCVISRGKIFDLLILIACQYGYQICDPTKVEASILNYARSILLDSARQKEVKALRFLPLEISRASLRRRLFLHQEFCNPFGFLTLILLGNVEVKPMVLNLFIGLGRAESFNLYLYRYWCPRYNLVLHT